MSSDAALLQEIQRLSGAINRHKSTEERPPYAAKFKPSYNPSRYPNYSYTNKTYVNPAISNQKFKTSVLPDTVQPSTSSPSTTIQPPPNITAPDRELVIDGVAFQSSNNKLVRKDLLTSRAESPGSGVVATSHPKRPASTRTYVKKSGNYVASHRVHKPKYTKRKPLGGRNNMVLDNIKGTRTGKIIKPPKQCRFFTKTGECQRGLTCPYQHDPEKIAICSLFLTDSCPNSADNCQLSHDPTPSRVPLCHHFANYGRCTRENCPYPHVRVGPRNGVCRDFAVVGYCDKGIDCDKQHVRECPDFAEKGFCSNKTCKLPHVIRANMRRKPIASTEALPSQIHEDPINKIVEPALEAESTSSLGGPSVLTPASAIPGTAAEYISLTFEESDEDEDEEEEDTDDDNDDDGDVVSIQEDEELPVENAE